MKTNRNISSTNWGLIARTLFDPEAAFASGNEKQQQEPDKEEMDELEQSRQLGKKIDILYAQKHYDAEKAWNKIHAEINTRKSRKISISRMIGVAASVALIALTAALAYMVLQPDKQTLTELAADNTPVHSYTLPDGSKVSLNAGSKILFPDSFSGETREVTMEGEGYFEVKPDPLKPFIIHAGKAQIRVLGTSFNVNAYPGMDKVEVIVDSGKVRVSPEKQSSSNTQQLILVPGEKGTLLNAEDRLIKSRNEDVNFLSWKTRCLTFKETSLKEVAASLGKAYQITVLLDSPKLDTLRLTGHYNNYPLEDILSIVSSALQVNIEKQGDNYSIRERK